MRKLRRRGAVGRHVQMRVLVAAEATEPFRAADLRLQQNRARIRWKEEACSKNPFRTFSFIPSVLSHPLRLVACEFRGQSRKIARIGWTV